MSGQHAKRLIQMSTGRPTEEVLRELYLDKRLTQHEIAKTLTVSRDTVQRWLAEYGIRREDRPDVEPLVTA